MKTVLFSSLLAFSLLTMVGCSGSDSTAPKAEKSMKCGDGKCGGDKKVEAKKCGDGKCGGDK